LKTDFIPIYSDGYKSKSLKFKLRANIEILYSVRYNLKIYPILYIDLSRIQFILTKSALQHKAIYIKYIIKLFKFLVDKALKPTELN
jgi:hypothetical protein